MLEHTIEERFFFLEEIGVGHVMLSFGSWGLGANKGGLWVQLWLLHKK
jgi:hypothetical protein